MSDLPRLIVERPGGAEDIVEFGSVAFDGGVLIAFRDEAQKHIAGAWGIGGWDCARLEDPQ